MSTVEARRFPEVVTDHMFPLHWSAQDLAHQPREDEESSLDRLKSRQIRRA